MTTTPIQFSASTTPPPQSGSPSRSNDAPPRETGSAQGSLAAASGDNALLNLLFGN